MVSSSVQVGQIVSSGAGRDKEHFFIVYNILNDSMVEIVDGKLRKLEGPKKKNLKHLVYYPEVIDEIAEKLLKGDKVNNAMIRKALANSKVVKRLNCSAEGGRN